MRTLLQVAAICFLTALASAADPFTGSSHPNIVVIYVDDVGFGDVGCYGATAVKTPNIDRLAREGCLFRDGHSSSATCTPSRFSLLTGEYAWRQKGTGIAPGDANLIIPTDRMNLASMLKGAGYRSAVIGKWHLGLGKGPINWNQHITPGPAELGFNESFLIPATGDRVPCVYVENQTVVSLDPDDPITVSFGKKIGDDPTGLENPERLKMKWDHGHNATIINGISRIGFMSGGQSARWVDEDMADVITQKAISFIERHQASHHQQPFFLHFNPHDIHVPRVPHARFVGSTSMGPRGDVITELDWCVGQILNALDQYELSNNTLVIFTSDNGPVLNDGYVDDAVEKLGDHRPSGPFRGGKYSAFEAGTRVPFLVRWPEKVAAGTTSDALVCQIDFLASFAALTEQQLPEHAGPDSINTMPAFLGEDPRGRDHLVLQAGALSLRQGSWKLIESKSGPAVNKNVNIELGNAPQVQLYDLSSDPAENANVAADHPERVAEMQERLTSLKKNGKSR